MIPPPCCYYYPPHTLPSLPKSLSWSEEEVLENDPTPTSPFLTLSHGQFLNFLFLREGNKHLLELYSKEIQVWGTCVLASQWTSFFLVSPRIPLFISLPQTPQNDPYVAQKISVALVMWEGKTFRPQGLMAGAVEKTEPVLRIPRS